MNREEFISYLKKPASLDKKSLPEINELIEEFPFFQSGHLLFLKNLNNLDHIRFGSQLKRSSSIVSDRERLYNLLFPASEMDFEKTAKSESETIVNLEEAREEKQKEESKASPIKESITSGEDRSTDDLRTQVERRLAEIRGEDIHEVKEEKPEPSPEIIEKGKVQAEESMEDTESKINDKNGDNNIIDKESKLEERTDEAGELLLLGDEKEMDDLPDDIEYPVHEEGIENYALLKEESLLDLDRDRNGEEAIATEAEMEKEIESGDIEDTMKSKKEIHSFESWLNLLGTGHSEEDVSEMNESVSGQREIIDKFIQENPRIQPNQDYHYEKGDMSADSVTEKDELFTETLANIYIKQGYYSKAIFFYQELSLKFPEKSAYFARRIKEIEKRINKL